MWIVKNVLVVITMMFKLLDVPNVKLISAPIVTQTPQLVLNALSDYI